MSSHTSQHKAKRIIVWFRQDLRLHDNEALSHAIERGIEVIPVYVFDERHFQGTTSFGFRKTGKFRAQFLIESVQDLRNSFQKLGLNLLVRFGKPEEEVFKLCTELQANWVYCNMERTHEEAQVQNALEHKLWGIGVEIQFHRGKMLYYTQDLPFPIPQAPDVFTTFRKEVEKYIPIREPLAAPTRMNPWSCKPEPGEMPDLQSLGYEIVESDTRAAIHFEGGETAGLARLHHYLWGSNAIAQYKETRNGLLGADYSSKFSAWLAQGCLSPKQIYHELCAYEQQVTKNESTYWMFFELLWRDFFRIMGKKYGNKIFFKTGLNGQADPAWTNDRRRFDTWAQGQTGVPFVDANMQELNATGFMSNRGRQIVASYLVKDLHVNWLMGAEYFESLLIDYDVCSNYGNWLYVAGVGNDPREDRYFNPQTQAQRYDANGEYVKHWLGEVTC